MLTSLCSPERDRQVRLLVKAKSSSRSLVCAVLLSQEDRCTDTHTQQVTRMLPGEPAAPGPNYNYIFLPTFLQLWTWIFQLIHRTRCSIQFVFVFLTCSTTTKLFFHQICKWKLNQGTFFFFVVAYFFRFYSYYGTSIRISSERHLWHIYLRRSWEFKW